MSRYALFGLLPIMVTLALMLVEIATGLYAPVMPIMMHDFGAPEYMIQLTITADLLGLAFAGLIFGPLSDQWGRRRLMLMGLGLFTMAGLLCALAPALWFLILVRVLQGIGSGTVIVVGISAIKDQYDETSMARIISFLAMVIAVSPAIAPIIGGYIGTFISWRAIFFVLTAAGTLVLVLYWRYFPETLAKEKCISLPWRAVVHGYFTTLQNKGFVIYTALTAVTVAIWWTQLSNLPFLFVEEWGVASQHYGFYFSTYIVFYVMGTVFNTLLVNRIGVDKMLWTGVSLKAFSALALCLVVFSGHASPWAMLMCYYPGAFGVGLYFGNAYAKAMTMVSKHVGLASALVTLAQMLVASVAILLVGYFYNGTALPLAAAELLGLAIFALLFWLVKRR